MNVEAALYFIQKHGGVIDKYRVNYLLNGSGDEEVPLKILRTLQNEDGGFPYNLEKGNLSSVNETCSLLNLISELNLEASPICKKALQFLLQTQQPDGSWDENSKIKEYNPPFWNAPGKLETKTWLTAAATNNLILLGYRRSDQVKKAAKFLKENMDENGKIAGFRIATWIAISVFAQLEDLEKETLRKSLQLFEEWLQKEKTDASFLNWYLECLLDAKIPQNHPLVQKCLKKLVKLQQRNGSWTSADGAKHTVSTTVTALKMLRNYGFWTNQGEQNG
ncbi:MAG: prenyltransferase/squalene oxidase repeat-containing protein [Candidatus Bathyarchaeia archaeon]